MLWLQTPLWFEDGFGEKPRLRRSREALTTVETAAIEWRDAGVRAPFEVLLAPRTEETNYRSSAFARPLGAGAWPFVALGDHCGDGPRLWRDEARFDRDRARGEVRLARHLRRVLAALLRRRLWGRVLWLDRELNLVDDETGVLRLYLGADGRGQWFLPGMNAPDGVRAPFDWQSEPARLLGASDAELLERVHALAERTSGDLAFALNWVSWGRAASARAKRVELNWAFARGSLGEMREVLGLALACDPELTGPHDLHWNIDPLADLTQIYGAPGARQIPARAGGGERLFEGHPRPLPPFARAIREWAHGWFGVQLNRELRARHRCVSNVNGALAFTIERLQVPTAHERLEAYAQLRDFVAARAAPDEVVRLLRGERQEAKSKERD